MDTAQRLRKDVAHRLLRHLATKGGRPALRAGSKSLTFLGGVHRRDFQPRAAKHTKGRTAMDQFESLSHTA